MPIDTLVFDFGNVLGTFSHRKAAEQLAALSPHALKIEEMIDFLYFTDLEPTLEVGKLDSAALIELLRRRYDLRGSDDLIRQAYADMFEPIAENCQLIEQLQGKYRLLLLSNTNELHYEQFRKQFAGTLGRFDALVLSHLVGLRKPSETLYRHLEELAGTTGNRILFIDDLSVNVQAAGAIGWQTIQYLRGADLADLLRQRGINLA